MTYVCMLHNYVIMKENITSDYIYMYHISGRGTKLNFGEASSLVHAIVIITIGAPPPPPPPFKNIFLCIYTRIYILLMFVCVCVY